MREYRARLLAEREEIIDGLESRVSKAAMRSTRNVVRDSRLRPRQIDALHHAGRQTRRTKQQMIAEGTYLRQAVAECIEWHQLYPEPGCTPAAVFLRALDYPAARLADRLEVSDDAVAARAGSLVSFSAERSRIGTIDVLHTHVSSIADIPNNR